MKTLHEHNEEHGGRRRPIKRDHCGPAGVTCPICQEEMVYQDGAVLMTQPPKMRVACPGCGHKGEKVLA